MTSTNDLRTELLADADRLEAEDDTVIACNIREAVAALDERDEIIARQRQQIELLQVYYDAAKNEEARQAERPKGFRK